MKKFDIVWGKGKLRFSDINVPAADVEAAIAAVRAKHGWMVEKIISVTEFVPSNRPLIDDALLKPSSMPSWGTYGT
jgi:hypothetical protein